MNINFRLSELHKLKLEMLRVNSPSKVTLETITALEEQINNEIDNYTEQKVKARELISGLSDDRYKAVLTEYYLNTKTWEQVADSMNVSNRHVTRIHGWALKEFSRVCVDVLVCPY